MVPPHPGASLSPEREALTLATTWTDPENMMLSERSRHRRACRVCFHLWETSRTGRDHAQGHLCGPRRWECRYSLQGLQLFCRLENAHRKDWCVLWAQALGPLPLQVGKHGIHFAKSQTFEDIRHPSIHIGAPPPCTADMGGHPLWDVLGIAGCGATPPAQCQISKSWGPQMSLGQNHPQ